MKQSIDSSEKNLLAEIIVWAGFLLFEQDMKAKTNKWETCEIKKDNKKFMRSMKNELKKKVMNEKHMR